MTRELKDIVKELAQAKINHVVIEDLHDNVYTYVADLVIEDGIATIILPFSVKDHDWREDIAQELYK